MALRQCADFSGTNIHFCPIGHDNVYPTGDVVLKMRGFAPLRPCNRFHVLRPPPARFECEAANRPAAYIYQLYLPFLDFKSLRSAVAMPLTSS